MIRNNPQYRNGNGNIYIKNAAFISRACIIGSDQIDIEDRHMITGLTATLGCDILRKSTARFPAGTAFICEGDNPAPADPQQAVASSIYSFLACPIDHSLLVSSGTTLNRSPTRPISATWKIGASSSLLMAMMVFESFIPARCWIAPEMPTAI
jgi:hypothetical protein